MLFGVSSHVTCLRSQWALSASWETLPLSEGDVFSPTATISLR